MKQIPAMIQEFNSRARGVRLNRATNHGRGDWLNHTLNNVIQAMHINRNPTLVNIWCLNFVSVPLMYHIMYDINIY
jgi:hypothetical protein